MKVVLPDSSELELPEGATGLDAARAIGPKLAEQAVLVRSNGRVQDLRLPLENGQPIQILTSRDTDDPDALYVLRHSAAHLRAEAVRRIYPGGKLALGPPIENGFYYDFEFPEPIGENALERIEEEVRRELAEGRSWTREETSRDEARKRFEAEGEPYKVELVDTAEGDISLYTQGDFTDLCRGPHLQDSRPIKAFKLTGLAGAYWRGDEHNKQLTRIYDKSLWVTSGHWEKFRENMFLIPIDEEHSYAIKPMNCPGHMVLFGSSLRSYRDLPLRYAEAAPLHRNERAGTLHGLTRVRYVTQDDAHIFCSREQIDTELDGTLDYLKFLYGLFDLEPRAELSTRPDNKLGTDEEWDFTEAELVRALERHGIDYFVGEGEGSFYGPKIDLHMTDVLGRSWQLGTIQLDGQMPARFGLTYMGADNQEHPVFVIHRAFFGSFERFIGILIEHYAGAFPLWLLPGQIRVIPVGEDHRGAARALAEKLSQFRVEVDDSDETVGKRIRNAEVEKIPYVVVYGDRESEEALAIRERGGEQSTRSLDEFVRDLTATL